MRYCDSPVCLKKLLTDLNQILWNDKTFGQRPTDYILGYFLTFQELTDTLLYNKYAITQNVVRECL